MNLKEAIEDEGLKMNRLAERLSVSTSYLSTVVHGKANISMELAERISSLFKRKYGLTVSVEEIRYPDGTPGDTTFGKP